MDRSAPVTPVSEIEAGAVRRDPPVPRYGGDESRRSAPAPSYHSGKSYTVVEGDTLFNIARYELGKASRWVEIYELNHDVLGKDFNYLTPGMKLVLPEGDRPDVIAQPPSGTYRR
jgi:nucleoid-associated protein YgaU